jgi:hypothetical protein
MVNTSLKFFITKLSDFAVATALFVLLPVFFVFSSNSYASQTAQSDSTRTNNVKVHQPVMHDVSSRLLVEKQNKPVKSIADTQDTFDMTVPDGAAEVEQTSMGSKPPPQIVANFDGLGVGFEGPQGRSSQNNPSDNSLAVGPNHIVQTINTRMAIFTKKGQEFDTTGKPLYGPVQTRNVFRGFGGPCEQQNNGDAVVRYDQLADRWLIVMPIFSRIGPKIDRQPRQSGEPAKESLRGQSGQPGSAVDLYEPPLDKEERKGWPERPESKEEGSYSMCYAVSTSSDPFGSYYRYEFVRQHFPDYPRPAVWPDGYYVPTSAGDNVVKKQACVAEREKMLKGEDASEQCVIIDDVNFLNNADVLGKQQPPDDAPNIMMATGGTQLEDDFEDDGIYVWNFDVNWEDPSETKVEGPEKISVAPYHYLCDGQLQPCVPQPGTDQRLDSQGDKIMSRLVYRRIDDRESIVGVHSVNTSAGGGGVRWYEFRLDQQRNIDLYQQGTYAPDKYYRWMASPAIDASGNIGIGYSFGGTPNFAGQRFAGRMSGDPKGELTLKEAVLVEGKGVQTNTMRWEDYTQTAVDPSDDCTIWYVGDYYKKGADNYSTRIGAFRMPECTGNK